MEIHEAANIFPLDEEHLDGLAADIKANGLRVPVELLDGKIIDGRRRSRACEMAGVTPKYRVVVVADPVAYVLSLNLHRRHLTPSQLSLVAARARSIYDAQAKARQGARTDLKKDVPANLPECHRDARDAAGKAVGVSGKSVDFATRVLAKGVPELIAAVDDGRMAVSTAAVIASDSPDEQRAYVGDLGNRKYRAGRGGGDATVTPVVPAPNEPRKEGATQSSGVGVRRANEAVDCLRRIPKNDSLRARGFQIVTDWIRQNR